MFKIFSLSARTSQYKQIKPLLWGSFLQMSRRNFICSSVNLNQQELSNLQIKKESIEGVKFLEREKILSVKFEDNSEGYLPFLWLRDNCQCPSCFNKIALARNFLLQNLNLKVVPTEIKNNKDVLEVIWNDGHSSSFNSSWLYERAFNNQARTKYEKIHRLQKKPWGKNLQLDIFKYDELMNDESSLLKWLLTMEVKGVALIKNCPNNVDAGPDFGEKIGFVKNTHYGRRSTVVVRPDSNNLAFTNAKLGLHNDLPHYHYQPGIILLHMVEQHRGKGGESTISDGLLATEILRIENPKAFDILSKTDVYFWDKGSANNDMESEKFYKINKAPIIGLNRENKFEIMRVNNQVRDSHLDLPAKEVNSFYEAMKALWDILEDNCYGFKMEDGDLLTLDNIRCLHGREKFENESSRHLETSYVDWDEAFCCRRRLVEKLGIDYPPSDL